MTIVATCYQEQDNKISIASDTIACYSGGRISHNSNKITIGELPIAMAVGIAGSAWVGTVVRSALRAMMDSEEFEFDSPECFMMEFNDLFLQYRDSVPGTDKTEYQYQAIFADYDREDPVWGMFTGYGDGGVEMFGDDSIGAGADLYQGAAAACAIHTSSKLTQMLRGLAVTCNESASCGGDIDLVSIDITTGVLSRHAMKPDAIMQAWRTQVS